MKNAQALVESHCLGVQTVLSNCHFKFQTRLPSARLRSSLARTRGFRGCRALPQPTNQTATEAALCDNAGVVWLGERRGFLSDWLTQQWVRATGRKIRLSEQKWLDGPVGHVRQIGKQFFADHARIHHFEMVEDETRGLVPNFEQLELHNVSAIAPSVRQFYEQTSEFELDAWSEWCGFFKPFGRALAVLFSRRLQQLNVPLSSLDSSRGISSSVLQWRDPTSRTVVQTAWVRELHATKNVLYAGSYSISRVPGIALPCVKVVFPLPNGNAVVLMKPEVHADGSFSVTSAGVKFGDPGFYFVVHGQQGVAWARYVRGLQESIRVYSAEPQTVRADHVLRLWGLQFLNLHYRMRLMSTLSMSPA